MAHSTEAQQHGRTAPVLITRHHISEQGEPAPTVSAPVVRDGVRSDAGLLTPLLTTAMDMPGQCWMAERLGSRSEDGSGPLRTSTILLRIRRLGVRIPPAA
ncbi:hypothetical protein Airi02_061000 [Actinoallomurus iriomotensis]|uniref:Uncharacterized protein n=1 Tax=Actinoallomurus iriomotensis TaxID=478107 RepID=A0A9W6S6P1_9ACTN|nr:hypothetical protein Airi02_061000 [Actinoallomurus iriomotensis]